MNIFFLISSDFHFHIFYCIMWNFVYCLINIYCLLVSKSFFFLLNFLVFIFSSFLCDSSTMRVVLRRFFCIHSSFDCFYTGTFCIFMFIQRKIWITLWLIANVFPSTKLSSPIVYKVLVKQHIEHLLFSYSFFLVCTIPNIVMNMIR